MKIQSGKTFIIAALIISVTMPFSVSAAPSAGIKPSSIFYFLDIASERLNLFFTFKPEKKARKALEYADERLAEAQAVAGDNDAQAVKTAITNYESSIALAAEKSKDIGEKDKAEALLTTISDNTSRHQEILIDVLAKVPDEAKEAISKAIEVSRRGQEEALQKISELKGEVEQLKQEVAELKAKDEERAKVIEELNKRKPQTVSTPTSIPAQPSTSKSPEVTSVPKPETTSQGSIKKDEPQSTPPANQTQDNNTSTLTPPPPPPPPPSSVVALPSTPPPPSATQPPPTTPSPAPFDFSLSNSGNKTVIQGQSVTNIITVSLVSGNTQGVSFAVSGLPEGVSQSFSRSSCSPVCTSNLILSANSSATIGNSPITVTGTAGAIIHTTTFTLTVLPHFVADISFDKDTVANDETDSIKVTIITKDSTGAILSNKAVQVQTDKTQNFVSDANGVIKMVITTTGAAGSYTLMVKTDDSSNSDNYQNSKNYKVINVRKKLSFGVLSAADFGNISAPAINEGLIMLVFDKTFPEIQSPKLKKVSFKLEGLTPDWITNIKFTKSEADDRHDVLPPVIIPSTYSFTSDGMVSLTPSEPIEMFYNDRLTIVADIKNNSDIKSGTGAKILEYAVVVYQDSFGFSGMVSGFTGVITPELTNYNYGPNALLTLPSRKTNWLVTNYCGSATGLCFDQ